MKTQTPAQYNRAKKVQKNLVTEIKYLNETITDIEDSLYGGLTDLDEAPSLYHWYSDTVRNEVKQAKFYESKGGFINWACSGFGEGTEVRDVGSSRVDLQACKLEYSIVSPK